ncbi:AMP-binding protein, partial [Streptomyces xanthochromogenes]|uniref:AMP-binding protein n=2 Tax=Streptomyces xanthochromogenes TaxID=67384 RepID=UPI0016782932
IVGAVEYSSDLYDASTVQSLFERWVRLLDEATAHPEQPLDTIDLLTTDERHDAVVEFNDTALPLPELSLGELFVRQVARTPDAPAVTDGESSLTYAELDVRADRFAGELVARGVRPGDAVAVLLRRSVEMVTTVLGLMKAGAVYVPLDVRYPAERIRHVLTETGARLLVTDDPSEPQPGAEECELIGAASIGAAETEPGGPGEVTVHPESAAYVMYTSGSSGVPKGVVV